MLRSSHKKKAKDRESPALTISFSKIAVYQKMKAKDEREISGNHQASIVQRDDEKKKSKKYILR